MEWELGGLEVGHLRVLPEVNERLLGSCGSWCGGSGGSSGGHGGESGNDGNGELHFDGC